MRKTKPERKQHPYFVGVGVYPLKVAQEKKILFFVFVFQDVYYVVCV
jgi:hypothetical protein